MFWIDDSWGFKTRPAAGNDKQPWAGYLTIQDDQQLGMYFRGQRLQRPAQEVLKTTSPTHWRTVSWVNINLNTSVIYRLLERNDSPPLRAWVFEKNRVSALSVKHNSK